MKSYKDFQKQFIGESDIACLIMFGCRGGTPLQQLNFGQDDSYYAYIVPENDIEIGEHYHLVAMFEHWLKIYDDKSLVKTFHADQINVYRAGEMGCIIQLINY